MSDSHPKIWDSSPDYLFSLCTKLKMFFFSVKIDFLCFRWSGCFVDLCALSRSFLFLCCKQYSS